jgi:hypothetical protein
MMRHTNRAGLRAAAAAICCKICLAGVAFLCDKTGKKWST